MSKLIETREGYLLTKLLPDGREASVCLLTFGRARIVVGPADGLTIDDGF